jgi:hypothetical protein
VRPWALDSLPRARRWRHDALMRRAAGTSNVLSASPEQLTSEQPHSIHPGTPREN